MAENYHSVEINAMIYSRTKNDYIKHTGNTNNGDNVLLNILFCTAVITPNYDNGNINN